MAVRRLILNWNFCINFRSNYLFSWLIERVKIGKKWLRTQWCLKEILKNNCVDLITNEVKLLSGHKRPFNKCKSVNDIKKLKALIIELHTIANDEFEEMMTGLNSQISKEIQHCVLWIVTHQIKIHKPYEWWNLAQRSEWLWI